MIEYSGYGYADPAGPQSGISILANLMGFTVVDVNMRGTGCSGGAFDFFEPLQNLDGYDVIETIARQPWALHQKVGMMGISYGGISQLFTAQTNPPSLAAISPLSVLDSTQTTLYPGGILNTGFALNWALERVHDAKPAGPNTGQPWAYQRIQQGDQTCKANQALHGEAANLLAKIRANDHYVPKVADPLAPITFVNKINVPVFMACQWTDEQTGGHCPTSGEALHRHPAQVVHVHQRHPRRLARSGDLQPLVRLPPALRRPAGADHQLGGDPRRRAGDLPGGDGDPGGDDAARSDSSAADLRGGEGRIRAAQADPDPVRQRRRRLPARPAASRLRAFVLELPHPGHQRPLLVPLGAGARFATSRPQARGPIRSTGNAHARPLTNFTGDTGAGENGLWTATPPYNWRRPPAGSAVSYLTPPLGGNNTVIGAGAVRAWVRSSTPNVDLQATITEVRPDGKETFVQNGWVRGNERKLDAQKSTLLEPVLSLRASDVSPLPPNRFVKVTIPLYYEGHTYRAGSRIRVTITAPNGDQPIWSFGETQPAGGHATVSIAHSRAMPSQPHPARWCRA